MSRILLIEDDYDIAANIQDYLEARSFSVTYAPNGALGLHYALSESFDAVVLDVRMPGIDGVSVCEQLRASLQRDWPVLMLTAADALPDRLRGFEAGADDYVVKPFALEELQARLEAIIRRSAGQGSRQALRVGELSLDLGRRAAYRNGVRLELTNINFRILKMLAQRFPDILERGELEYALWGDEPPSSDALRSHIFALRSVLDKPFDKPMLVTHRGVGYQLASV